MSAVRSQRWQLVQYGKQDCALFDLTADPADQTDVGNRCPDACSDLRARLTAHYGGVDDSAPRQMPDEECAGDESVQDGLRNLAYIA